MTAWTNYLQYTSFQMKHHLQFRAWIFKSMASMPSNQCLTCLAERSFFEGKLGLEVGVTGALWLPLLNNDRTLSNHLILENNSDFQEVWTSQSSSRPEELERAAWNFEIFWSPARCVQRYRWRRGQIPEQITDQTGYDLHALQVLSFSDPPPAFAPPATSRVTLNPFPAFLLPPSVAFPFAPSPSLSLFLSLSATPSPHFLSFQRPHLSFLYLTEQSPLGCPML